MGRQNPQLSRKQREELFDGIMHRISLEKKRAEFRQSAFFGATFILSLIAIYPAFRLLQANLVASGFYDYFSLIFSDSGMIARYWDSFAMTILEVLPVMSLAAFLTVVFVMLGSLRHLAVDFHSRKASFKFN